MHSFACMVHNEDTNLNIDQNEIRLWVGGWWVWVIIGKTRLIYYYVTANFLIFFVVNGLGIIYWSLYCIL